MVKVIGIAGSPRRNGNSATLMRAVLSGTASCDAATAEVCLNDLQFRGCQGCQPCGTQDTCVVKDALSPVYAALQLADIYGVSCIMVI